MCRRGAEQLVPIESWVPTCNKPWSGKARQQEGSPFQKGLKRQVRGLGRKGWVFCRRKRGGVINPRLAPGSGSAITGHRSTVWACRACPPHKCHGRRSSQHPSSSLSLSDKGQYKARSSCPRQAGHGHVGVGSADKAVRGRRWGSGSFKAPTHPPLPSPLPSHKHLPLSVASAAPIHPSSTSFSLVYETHTHASPEPPTSLLI